MYKGYYKILYARLVQWLNAYDILPESQHGFRSGHSTITAISTLMKDVDKALDESMPYYICFVDFRKAFDFINRRILFTKLHTLGISGHFLNVLFQRVVNNFVYIRIDQYLTDQLPQNIGVPQGDRLAPLLFTVFIADLDIFLRKTGVTVVFYADDLAIGHTDLSKLQRALLTLGKYCEKNDLEVNTEKTKVMKMRKAGRLCLYDLLTYKNTALEFVNTFNYMGAVLQTNANPTSN